MIRRVNFTERTRIPASLVKLEIIDGDPRTFRADIDIERIKESRHSPFPKKATVIFDATCPGSEIVQRFDYGTIH